MFMQNVVGTVVTSRNVIIGGDGMFGVPMRVNDYAEVILELEWSEEN